MYAVAIQYRLTTDSCIDLRFTCLFRQCPVYLGMSRPDSVWKILGMFVLDWHIVLARTWASGAFVLQDPLWLCVRAHVPPSLDIFLYSELVVYEISAANVTGIVKKRGPYRQKLSTSSRVTFAEDNYTIHTLDETMSIMNAVCS